MMRNSVVMTGLAAVAVEVVVSREVPRLARLKRPGKVKRSMPKLKVGRNA